MHHFQHYHITFPGDNLPVQGILDIYDKPVTQAKKPDDLSPANHTNILDTAVLIFIRTESSNFLQ